MGYFVYKTDKFKLLRRNKYQFFFGNLFICLSTIVNKRYLVNLIILNIFFDYEIDDSYFLLMENIASVFIKYLIA